MYSSKKRQDSLFYVLSECKKKQLAAGATIEWSLSIGDLNDGGRLTTL